jgi:glutaminyl-peptide cyclotransferase
MKNKIIGLAALALMGNGMMACDGNKKETAAATETTAPATTAPTLAPAPAFQADSAYAFVARQVSFGPRVPNTAAHRACGDYLIRTLKALGAQVTVQEFESTAYDGKRLKLRNIVGAYNPQATNRVLLAAHWDTRPWADKDAANPTTPSDGANDGASGVGVLLEVARTLHSAQANPGVGVDIIFFDGEDYGDAEGTAAPQPNYEQTWCLGSQYWARNLHQPGYRANFGILLDMVGAKGAQFAIEENSRQLAPQVLNTVWKTAHQLGYSNYFTYTSNGAITDDHLFMNKGGVPSIDILDYDPTSPDGTFGKYHHRHADNMDIIDRNTLKAVGQTLLQVIYNQQAV